MKIEINTFRGMSPRVAPRLLPEGMAQQATCPRLLSGDLESWYDYVLVQAMAKDGGSYTGAINTIYPMDIDGASLYWLHWADSELGATAVEVDVALGPIPGDTTERTYITGLDAPRVTNLALATDPSNQGANVEFAYPYITYLLGVPAPTAAPTSEVVVSAPAAGSVAVTNGDAESGTSTGWTIASGQLEVHDDNDVAVLPQEGSYFFYGGTSASSEAYQSIDIDAEGVLPGQGITLNWYQASGTNSSTAKLGLRFYDSGVNLVGEAFSSNAAPGSTWTARSVETVVPETAVTMRVVIIMTRVGAAENDAYIDAITLALDQYGYTSTGSDLDTWDISAFSGANPGGRKVSVDAYGGAYGDVFRFFADENTAWARRNFQLGSANFTIGYDLYLVHQRVRHYVTVAGDEGGAGEGIAILSNKVERRSFSNSDDQGVSAVQLDSGDNYVASWLRVTLTGLKTEAGIDLTVSVADKASGTELTNESISIAASGDWLHLKHWSNEGGSTAVSYVDNITVSVDKTVDSETETVSTNYVYTFVNLFDEEGPPSPVSSTIQRLENSSVTVTMATTAPSGYGVDTKYLYRAATADGVTQYFFVAEIPLATATYSDSKTDAELGDPLESQNYDLPPTDGLGITATANGITYLFSKNQLCPSVQNRPHAYPQDYRLSTDFPVVAIGAIDTDIVVATQANPYIVVGSDPSALSMAKLEKNQGCVSKRSMVTIGGAGVVYASPDGLTLVRRGSVEVITESLFSRKEWQALAPETIHGVEHDGRYIGFYDNGTPAGFIFDPNPNGFGWIDLDFYATAAYSNPLDDKLYLIIGGDLYIWDGDTDKRPYLWKSKRFSLPHPASFAAADIRLIPGSGTWTLKLYADGTLYYTKTITAGGEFNLPDTVAHDYFECELSGTGTVKSIRFSEDMDEIPQ